MVSKKPPMRQQPRLPGRVPGAPWREVSPYPVFEIFRPEAIQAATDYTKRYLREIASQRVAVPDRLVKGMIEYTGWDVERLFGAEFKEEWESDHPAE